MNGIKVRTGPMLIGTLALISWASADPQGLKANRSNVVGQLETDVQGAVAGATGGCREIVCGPGSIA